MIHLPTAFNWRSLKATHRVPGSGSFAGGHSYAPNARERHGNLCQPGDKIWLLHRVRRISPKGHSGSRVNSSDDMPL